ncbi:hypothetical protein FB451DRAFT_1178086 [Mycena latifolia]|nr:hypothetical protein FB451DRAFT_1178086 [Mycena latifolia]
MASVGALPIKCHEPTVMALACSGRNDPDEHKNDRLGIRVRAVGLDPGLSARYEDWRRRSGMVDLAVWTESSANAQDEWRAGRPAIRGSTTELVMQAAGSRRSIGMCSPDELISGGVDDFEDPPNSHPDPRNLCILPFSPALDLPPHISLIESQLKGCIHSNRVRAPADDEDESANRTRTGRDQLFNSYRSDILRKGANERILLGLNEFTGAVRKYLVHITGTHRTLLVNKRTTPARDRTEEQREGSIHPFDTAPSVQNKREATIAIDSRCRQLDGLTVEAKVQK